MVHLITKILGLVISAIKNLCELKGCTSQEILHYISSIYNIPSATARCQMQSALKRGVTCGILKKTGNHYSLPIDNEIARQEVAIQEIGLLDLYCQRKIQRSRNRRVRFRRTTCKCKRRSAQRKSRGCGPRSCRRRRQRRRRRCRCRGFDKCAYNRKTKSRTKYSLNNDKLTRSDRTAIETATANVIEQSYLNIPPVEC
ncbi:uncharacterized protein LOC112637272 [Camponotus floridanus]|uniref:uncharacterized protein LOC112637272 n=1 Tax=Camponotus floridanus TaxID=104421 RepID=UPI000DC6C1CD|nr:uncharacterized protein LOC112637272 [Camponotus floridanus]